MSSNHSYAAMAVWCVSFLFLVPGLSAQANAPRHVGIVQDWSDHHIVFTLDGLIQHPELISQEHRIARQILQRYRAPGSNFVRQSGPQLISSPRSTHHRDWNVDFVRGHVATEGYPSKFSFDPGGTPDCNNDYVVFGLNIPGGTNQANLIGFNNLYSGTAPNGLCGIAGPTVLFAYNVTTAGAGAVLLPPVISEDGKKIAFVESVPGGTPSTIFHVLTWTPGGTITSPADPGSAMTSLTVAAADSTTSAPWVDYASDTSYLGVNGGVMYAIHPVFGGTPALVPGWGFAVSGGQRLTPPVLDNRINKLIVGSTSGNLFQIDPTIPAVTQTLSVGVRPGSSIAAAPIVDVTNGTTFVVSGDDGTSAVLVQVNTASLTLLSSANIGLGAHGGTLLTIQQPALDNNYYNGQPNGVIRVCGTGASDTSPWQYSFGFTGIIMNTLPVFSQQLVTSTAATCTAWTEFFNPNIGVGGTDFFFFGLSQDCTGASTPGCVIARTTDIAPLVTVNIPGGPSGIVVDNYSTEPQASSIYLSATGATTAYKFTQNGLN